MEKMKYENGYEELKRFINLRDTAEKLANGEMTLEEFTINSQIGLYELISFAKKQEMSFEIIRKLSYMKEMYNIYTIPFEREGYLAETIIIVDGKDVKPTDKDIDDCIDYLRANRMVICHQTVSETVRKYLRGEIDITLPSEGKENLNEQLESEKTKQFSSELLAEKSEQSLSELAAEEKKQQELEARRKRIREIVKLIEKKKKDPNVK